MTSKINKNVIEELRWRGMLQDYTPNTEQQLLKEMTSAYVGCDPTASSLHIGNLATLMLLVHLQRAGHKPFALIGGATGMIGDPSGKSEERKLLSEETLRENQEGLRVQLSKLLDFDCGENSAEIVNNYDWFKEIGFLQFLRETGKFLTVNYMMSKDSVKSRMESGISFTEFSYQLLQGYDFYHLHKHRNVKMQMGGSDQWGNITTGVELIRRMNEEESHAFALTCPLVTKSDGTKFGKSEGGNIWLDPERTSPYKFYQFWLNVSDEDASKLIRVFTLLDRQTIEDLEVKHKENPHLRILQAAIAKDVTVRIHSESDYENAVKASQILFGKSTLDTLKEISESLLMSVLEGVPQQNIRKADFEATENIVDLLSVVSQNTIFPSKSEAKKMIKGGGVSINKTKIQETANLKDFELLHGKYLLVSKGKAYHLLVIEQ